MLPPDTLIERFHRRVHLLDGALATELQARGVNIDGPLWSGHALLRQPEAIEQLHYDYLAAGADVLITAGYQVSIPGMIAAGHSKREAMDALRRSVSLATNARARFLEQHPTPKSEHLTPLIAASIGPYGAFTADGGEYHGNYGISVAEFAEFHASRLEILADSDADLIAFETTPSLEEARAYAELLHRRPAVPAWISFSCRDGEHTCHGEHIADCARELDRVPNIVAIGVNCTAPTHIRSLIRHLRAGTSKPIVVYPNSGESWDAERHCFVGASHAHELAARAREWVAAGANLIGGCCRTGPAQIAALRAVLG